MAQAPPYRVHSSDLRIRVVDTGLETYPDVTVLCGRVEVDAEDDGRWTRHEARTGGSVEIASLACKLSVDEVYRDPLAVG
jgi:hypothetical protein